MLSVLFGQPTSRMTSTTRTIRKYANRRLYDTGTSQSITLKEVQDLIGSGETIEVVEAKSGRNVTRSVLLQIVADQELFGRPVLSNEFLEALIRINSNPMRDLGRAYLEQAMAHLQSQQHTVEQAWSDTLKSSGLKSVSDLTLKPFRAFQRQVLSMWSEALTPALPDEDPPPSKGNR